MKNVVFSTAALLCFAVPAAAQEGEPQPRKLTVRPAAEPKPALKYLLLPEVRDLQPGNAALTYLRAMSPEWYGNVSRSMSKFNSDETNQWFEMPLAAMPRERVASYLLGTSLLKEVELAARQEFCDWELLARLRRHGMGTLIGDIQSMRSLAYLLALRVRLEMLEGKNDQALHTFQTLLAMSRHVGDAPMLINGLVGLALAGMALDQLEEFIQQPGAPNLYWALMDLPRPFIDMRKGFESEKVALEVHLPELKTLDKEPLGPQDMARLTKFCSDNWSRSAASRPGSLARKLELVGLLLQHYPAARQALLDSGRKAPEVDALPMLQVVLIDHYQRFQQARDQLLKWNNVPWWQARNGMEKAKGEFKSGSQSDMWPFGTFMSATDRVRLASVRFDRKIAVLCCIEAVRMHVAATGKLPTSLADIGELPTPVDPVTGQMFEYTAKGNAFTLRGPSAFGPKGEPDPYHFINYQITIMR